MATKVHTKNFNNEIQTPFIMDLDKVQKEYLANFRLDSSYIRPLGYPHLNINHSTVPQ